MGDAQESRLTPPPGMGQQLPASRAVEPAAGLVEDHEAGSGPEQRASEPHPLSLTSGHESAPLAKHGL